MQQREYRIKINGEMDFIIISPQVLSTLIEKIHSSPECEVSVDVEDIMPPEFTDYLLRMINANRFYESCFRYQYIMENPITRKELYEILRRQLSQADMEESPCFRSICLTDTFQGKAELDMDCSRPFFWACKDTLAKFIYTFPDGRRETLVIEY